MKSRTKFHLYSALLVPLIATPYAHGALYTSYDVMSDLGTLRNDGLGRSTAYMLSADGSTVVGFAAGQDGNHHAYRWSTSQGTMQDLGTLRNDGLGASFAQAVSADGATVVGGADAQNGSSRAFRWSAAQGTMQDLGTLRNDGLGYSVANAVSADGSVVVGEAEVQDGNTRAYRWSASQGTMQDLGTLRNDRLGVSTAREVSADGSTVVGFAETQDGNFRAYRWSTSQGTMQDLGSLRDDRLGGSLAVAVSADGSTVVGIAEAQDGNNRAFRWSTSQGAMQDLGTLRSDRQGRSSPIGMTADGSTVVGLAEAQDGNSRAFRWSISQGAMQDLGSLRNDRLGYSLAAAVSADGSTVVGFAETQDGYTHAFRWSTSQGTMQDLGSLRDNGRGYSQADAVSADGNTIVGSAENQDGENRAFIYRVWVPANSGAPADRGVMQDYENVLHSFTNLANEIELAATQQQLAMSRVLSESCFVGAPGVNCMRISGVVSNTGSDGDTNRVNQTQGLLTVGHGISEKITLGISLSSGSATLKGSGIDTDSAYGFGIWGEYSEQGVARTGLQASVSVGLSTQNNDLTRGKNLSNVQELHGSAGMKTVAGRASLGYGLKQESGWLITPSVAVVKQHTTSDSYSENIGAITGNYTKSELNVTYIDLGVEAGTAINNVSSIDLGMGVEYDLQTDRMNLNVMTDVPGLESFQVNNQLDRNKARPYLTANYGYDLSVGGTVSAGIRVTKDTSSDAPQAAISVGYGVKF